MDKTLWPWIALLGLFLLSKQSISQETEIPPNEPLQIPLPDYLVQ